jgi:hypothetical protein
VDSKVTVIMPNHKEGDSGQNDLHKTEQTNSICYIPLQIFNAVQINQLFPLREMRGVKTQ